MRKVRIGTRGSRLALVQTEMVCARLRTFYPELDCEIVICKTLGDRHPELNLMENPGRGVFCGELENHLAHGEIDIAVHSVKDLPGELLPGLVLAGFLEREDPREALVSSNGLPLTRLPRGARIGTSSLRRLVQLKALRGDLEFKPIRGNVETRVKKVYDGEFDATILALAGLRRLGMEDVISEIYPIKLIIPAPGQGCIGMEIRENDLELQELLQRSSHPKTTLEIRAERAFLKRMGGYCDSAVGAIVQCMEPVLAMRGFYTSSAGEILIETVNGDINQPERLGVEVAERLLKRGGR